MIPVEIRRLPGDQKVTGEPTARYQVPIHVRIVGEFPMTPSGKIQKYILREQFLKGSKPDGGDDR